MSANVGEFLDLLDLEVIEDNLFRGRQPNTSMQRVFGGLVASHALVAATRTVDPQYVVHSLHSYFLRPGDTAVPIVYDVEAVRDGRSFATRRVLARQHGRPIFAMTLNFQIPEDGLEHQESMPSVPAPLDCPDLAALVASRGGGADEWPREFEALEVRFVGNSRAGGELHDPTMPAQSRLWMRVSGTLPENPLSHTAAFTYASDMTLLAATLVPHDVFIASPGMQAASLDHTIWFHRPFRADEWWLYDQHSPAASGGRGLAIARIFTADGQLVASVAQEGLIRFQQPG